MDSSASQPNLASLLDHSEWLHALARRLVRDPALADDLVQETWIAALRHPPDAARPPRPWLAGVLRNLVLLRRRTEGRRERRQHAAARPDRLPSAVEIAESVDTGRKLAGAVLELAEPYRTTVLLRYWHDLSSAEIARRQGVPEGTVRWRLKRGMDELRCRLDERYGERRAWELAIVGMLDARSLSRQGVLSSGSVVVAGALGSVALLAGIGWLLLATSRHGGERISASFVPLESVASATSVSEALASFVDEPVADAGVERVERVEPGERVESFAAQRSVTVLDALGSPVAGALVLLDDGKNDRDALTDEHGVARFVEFEGAARVYVRAEGAYLVTGELADGAPETSVALPAGAELSGRLVVAGAPPPESVRVALAIDHPLFDGPIPPAVLARFGTARRAVVHTGPDGEFRFIGLAADWSGTLELPRTWQIDLGSGESHWRNVTELQSGASGARVRFSRPTTGLAFALMRRLHLAGDVQTKDGAPAVDVAVELELIFADGATTHATARTSEEGRFALRSEDERFSRGALREAKLRAISADGLATVERVLTPDEALGGARLDALVIGVEAASGASMPGAPLEVLVRGSDDRNLAGVRAEIIVPEGVRESARFELADDGARASFPRVQWADAATLRLADALDRTILAHDIETAELAARKIDLRELPRLYSIALTVTDSGGRPLVGATVELAGSQSLRARSRTDAHGVLALAPLLGGDLDLIVRRAGYATTLARVNVASDGALPDIALESTVPGTVLSDR